MPINYHDCTLTAKNGEIYKYEMRIARKWNPDLKRHTHEPTGEITVLFPAITQSDLPVALAHFKTWDDAVEAINTTRDAEFTK